MILPGRLAVSRNIISALVSNSQQAQPCGVDLTLNLVKTFHSPGTIDFNNTQRQTASSSPLNFKHVGSDAFLDLPFGSYLVEFNETVDMPVDFMGQIFTRSSLWRSGATIQAGVVDSGYQGAVGAMLTVTNPYGLRIMRNAKLAQMVFHQMSEPVERYKGVYQGSKGV